MSATGQPVMASAAKTPDEEDGVAALFGGTGRPTEARTIELLGGCDSAIANSDVARAEKIVLEARLLDSFAAWMEEDRLEAAGGDGIPVGSNKRPGRTRQPVSLLAVLTALVLAALKQEPLLVTNVRDILEERISNTKRKQLGVSFERSGPFAPKAVDEDPHGANYKLVWRRIREILTVIEPYHYARNERLTKDEWAELQELWKQPAERAAIKRRLERLQHVVDQLLDVSFRAVPLEIRQRYKGSLVLDETFLELSARGTRKRSKFVSIEPWGGFYARSANKKGAKGKSPEQVATSGGEIVGKYARVPYGTGAMLALIGPSDPESRDTPALVIGMKLAGYSHDTTIRAAELIRGIQARGYPADYLAADRGLLPNSKPEHIQSAARAAGYKMVFDYKVTEAGLQESYNGAILVDGEWFCPQMPKRLVNATLTYKSIEEDKRTPADFELWMNQLQQRRAYVLRPNDKSQPAKSLDMVCPAYGPSPTARCPLRPSSTEPKHAGKTRITVVPDTPGKICTCKHTAAFPEAAGLKWRQDLPPFLEEWDKTYGLLRSFIESYNGFVKDQSRENAGAPGRRRMRGLAAQTLFVCLMVVAANLRKIELFCRTARPNPDGVPVALPSAKPSAHRIRYNQYFHPELFQDPPAA